MSIELKKEIGQNNYGAAIGAFEIKKHFENAINDLTTLNLQKKNHSLVSIQILSNPDLGLHILQSRMKLIKRQVGPLQGIVDKLPNSPFTGKTGTNNRT